MERNLYATRCIQASAFTGAKLHASYLRVGEGRSNKTEKIQRKDLSRFKKKLLNKEIDCLLFQDETMIRDYQAIQCTWFLRGQQRIIPTYGKITMILDNARIRHAQLIQPFLSENRRLTLVFLPPYSPNLNLIEGLWKWLKTDVIANVFYSSVAEICKNIQAFLAGVNHVIDVVIDRLCIKM